MYEQYIRFDIIDLFIFISDNIYFEFKPAFAVSCHKDFILDKHLRSIYNTILKFILNN